MPVVSIRAFSKVYKSVTKDDIVHHPFYQLGLEGCDTRHHPMSNKLNSHEIKGFKVKMYEIKFEGKGSCSDFFTDAVFLAVDLVLLNPLTPSHPAPPALALHKTGNTLYSPIVQDLIFTIIWSIELGMDTTNHETNRYFSVIFLTDR